MATSDNLPAVRIRRCPSGCGELSAVQFRGVMLDRCKQCAGIWFDHQEYETLDRSSEGALAALDELVQASDVPAATRGTANTRPRRCPSCDALMLPFAIHVGVPVTLDRCELCEGIWADDSELAHLCEALGRTPAAADALPPDARAAIALASFEGMSAHAVHRADAFHSLCAWIAHRPGLKGR